MSAIKASILFAEDDASLAFMVKDSLEDEGYKVLHCADGQTAIDAFDKTKFDICLLDIMMPVMDGFALLQALRKDPRTANIPVILLTRTSIHIAPIFALITHIMLHGTHLRLWWLLMFFAARWRVWC